jgi:hypothetical protein
MDDRMNPDNYVPISDAKLPEVYPKQGGFYRSHDTHPHNVQDEIYKNTLGQMYDDSMMYNRRPLPRTQPGYRDLESFPRTKQAYYDEDYINTRKRNVIDANNRRTKNFRSTSYYPPEASYQGEDPDNQNRIARKDKVRSLLERSKIRPRHLNKNPEEQSSVDTDRNGSRQLRNEPLA